MTQPDTGAQQEVQEPVAAQPEPLPDNAPEIVAEARRLAKANARAEKYGGSFGQHVRDRFAKLLSLVGLPDGWDTGPHTDDVPAAPVSETEAETEAAPATEVEAQP